MKYEINIEGNKIPYEVKIKKVKYLRITVKEDGLTVSVPGALKGEDIYKLLYKNRKWILENYNKINLNKPSWENISKILYKGQEYPVSIINNKSCHPKLDFKDSLFVVNVDKPRAECGQIIEKLFLDWYFKEAEKVIYDRTVYYSRIMKLNFNSLKIKNQKTRWGSCSSKKNLNFNFKLIMAPDWVLDYVVVHELSHLVYLDHSKNFWNVVSAYCPLYKEARKWLRGNAQKLDIF